jgi:ubiquitin-conjugating enzyme E2 W
MTTMQRSSRLLLLLLLLLTDHSIVVIAIQRHPAFAVNARTKRKRTPTAAAAVVLHDADDDNAHRKHILPSGNHHLGTMHPLLPLLELRGGGGHDDDENQNSIVETLLSSTSGILHNVIRSVCQYFGWIDVSKKRIEIKSSSKKKQKKSNKGTVSQTGRIVKEDDPEEGRTKTSKRTTKATIGGSAATAATSKTTKTKKSLSSSSSKSKTAGASTGITAVAKSSTTNTTKQKKNATNNKNGNSVHLKTTLKVTNPNYRIQQELRNFLHDPPDHLTVKVGKKNIRVWIVTMEGVGIYQGETFTLRIAFPAKYPTVPPSVYFTGNTIPQHEHVYTNGDICLSLLGKDWRPNMTAQSIAISILSILGSANKKSLPMDNARHAQNQPGQYQQDWVYHDDCTL